MSLSRSWLSSQSAVSQSVPLSHYPYRDSVGQDGTRRPRASIDEISIILFRFLFQLFFLFLHLIITEILITIKPLHNEKTVSIITMRGNAIGLWHNGFLRRKPNTI